MRNLGIDFFAILVIAILITGCSVYPEKVNCPESPNVLMDSTMSEQSFINQVSEDSSSIFFFPADRPRYAKRVNGELVRINEVFGKGQYIGNKVFNFRGTLSFEKELFVEHSQFNQNIIFQSSTDTIAKLTLEGVNFLKKFNISWSSDFTNLNLEKCYLADTLDFSGGRSKVKKLFSDSEPFGVNFKGRILIEQCTLCTMPDFALVSFDSSFTLSGSKFYCDSLVFRQTAFKYTPDFSFAELPKHIEFIDFENKNWISPLDLRTTKITSSDSSKMTKGVIRFIYGKDFNPANLDGGKFIIPSDRFRIEFGEDIPTWQQIVFLEQQSRKCQEVGLIDSHKDWEIQKKIIYTNMQWPKLGPLINIAEQYLWFFGYSPVLLIYWMALIFVIFWIVNYTRIERLIKNTYYDENLGRNFPKKIFLSSTLKPNLPFDTRSERIAYSFLFTAVIYFGFKINHEAINYRNPWGMAYVYFMYVAGTAHLALAFALLIK